MNKINPLPISQIEIDDQFWGRWQQLVKDEIVPYQWQALNDQLPDVEKSHTIDNFRIAAGEKKGDFYGMVFQDSDLAKWIETAAYVLAFERDEQLEQWIDQTVDLLEKAQHEDGYLNTYFTLVEPEVRLKNLRDGHELYCAGHLIEAAVAYYEVTGKRKLLDIVSRMADHMDELFGTESGKIRGYDGHPEIELALIRLYRATGKDKYLRLSKYFVDERGQEPHYFKSEQKELERIGAKALTPEKQMDYYVAHKPVREMTTAEGHAVRAVYLFSAMTDLAAEYGDTNLLETVKRLWDNVVNKRMYVTGGIGSAGHGERFTVDYDLPNERAYAETCASVGLIFWAQRLLELEEDGHYADIMELALYNSALSGISLDGKRYFYVNPLEVNPALLGHREDMYFVKGVRQTWYACACCPPNIARLLASLGRYIYSYKEDRKELYVNLYIGSKLNEHIDGHSVTLTQESSYPWDGDIKFLVDPAQPVEFTMSLRIPNWCHDVQIKINGESVETKDLVNGYCKLTRLWQPGDTIELTMPIEARLVRSHPLVRDNIGKVALMRGPLVYCLEEVDNIDNLQDISISKDTDFRVVRDQSLLEDGALFMEFDAHITERDASKPGELYFHNKLKRKPFKAIAIPYFLWANRQPGEMRVWIQED